MSKVVSRGRPSRWGKGESDKAAIAADVQNYVNLTPYYIQKLIDKGLLEIKITERGEKFVSENAA